MDIIDSPYLISSCWRVPIWEQFILIIIIDCEGPQMMMIYESYLLGGDRGHGVGLYWLKELVSLILSCVGGVINFNNMTRDNVYHWGWRETFIISWSRSVRYFGDLLFTVCRLNVCVNSKESWFSEIRKKKPNTKISILAHQNSDNLSLIKIWISSSNNDDFFLFI